MAQKKGEMDGIVREHDTERNKIENELAQKDEQIKEYANNINKVEREIKEAS